MHFHLDTIPFANGWQSIKIENYTEYISLTSAHSRALEDIKST